MHRKTSLLTAFIGLLFGSQASAIGAIAIDRQAGMEPAYGYSLGYGSQKDAEAAAIGFCRQYGGTDCQAMVWFETCGAYAESKKYFGIGWGADREAAARKALDTCSVKSCKILVAVCEGDK